MPSSEVTTCLLTHVPLTLLSAEYKRSQTITETLSASHLFRHTNLTFSNPEDVNTAVTVLLNELFPFQRAFMHGHIPRIPPIVLRLCGPQMLSHCLAVLYQLRIKTEFNSSETFSPQVTHPLWYYCDWCLCDKDNDQIAYFTSLEICQNPFEFARTCLLIMLKDTPTFLSSGSNWTLPLIWRDRYFLEICIDGALAALVQGLALNDEPLDVQQSKLIERIRIAVSRDDLEEKSPPYQALTPLLEQYRGTKYWQIVRARLELAD